MVHFVYDSYTTPKIKAEEQDSRGTSELHIDITEPNQKRSKDMKDALFSKDFKSFLLSYLALEWSQDKYKEVLSGHELYVSCGKECFLYTTAVTDISRKVVSSMLNAYTEADIRIILHLKYMNEERLDTLQ